MENGESVATSGTGKQALSLSKTMLNWSTLKTFPKNSSQWTQHCNEAHSFVCHSTLISCAGFKLGLLFTIATGVFALISLSLAWFAPRNPGMCPSEFNY